MPKTLDLANVISVNVQSVPANLNTVNINTVALFTRETPTSGWGGSDTYKLYTNASDVASDFGSNSNAYKISTAFFAQNPNPLATRGYLCIIKRASSGTESVQDAIIRMKDTVFFFGILVDEEIVEATFVTLTAYIQTLDKLFFYASSNVSDYAAGAMLDDIRTASKTHTRCLYYNNGTSIDTQKMAAAYAARGLSVDFSGSNTALTMNLKTLANVDPDTTVDTTALAAIKAAGVDCYVTLRGVAGVLCSGENGFFDQLYNEFWFKFELQTAGFNFLRAVGSKIPQTEIGIAALKNEFRKVCDQAVINGFIGPGTWTSPDTFGDQEAFKRNIKDLGYYVYARPLKDQSQADREDRIAPTIQIAVKTTGAVHSANVLVNVNL